MITTRSFQDRLDTLEAAREHLDPGASVVLTVEATLEGETLKLLARAVRQIDTVAADTGALGLRVHVETETAINSVAALLARVADEAKIKSRGPVSFCIADRDTGCEIDVAAGGDFPVNPQIKGAIKAIGGVVHVEDI